MTGACTTLAPSASSRRARPLAWARARVTATVTPAERARRQPRELLGERGDRADDRDRRRADLPRARAASAIVSSVPVTVRWPGSVPGFHDRRRLRRAGGRRRSASVAISGSRRTPM